MRSTLQLPLRGLPLLAAALAVMLAGCGESDSSAAGSAQAPEVGTYTVESKPLVLTTMLPGRTAAYRVAEVRPQVDGIILKRLFNEGSDVEEGEQLYQIDPAPYQAALVRADANLASAENRASRYKRLIETRAVSQQQYDDALAAWKQAEAEAQVARINMRYTKVLAPIGGRVERSTVTEGALVTNGQAQELTRVTQLDPIYVDIIQPVTELLRLRHAVAEGRLETNDGDQARVLLTLEDGSHYPLPGTLKFSEVTVDPATGSVTLRAEFPNPEAELLPGMFVRAELQEGVRQDATLVPQQAVSRNAQGAASVWVVKGDGTVEQRTVQAPRTLGNAWLIDEGLKGGDKVVVEGTQRLQSGMKVSPYNAEAVVVVKEYAQAGG